MKTRVGLVIMLALAATLPVGAMRVAAGAGVGPDTRPARPEGPGDIYTAAGTPCVAAHSTTRALYASYNGPLYQVLRQSDGKTLDIGVVQPSAGDAGGYADAAAQDTFCTGTVCWVTTIYDQSGKGNHLVQAPPGTFKGPAKGGFNTLPIADMAPITILGHKAYGVYIMPGMGLRNNDATGLAINDEPQGVTMVFDGTHYDSGCCFNYGNTSTNSRAVGRGTMDTVYFGTATAWGRGSGPGPWIMSDMEAGLFSGYHAGLNEGSPTIDSWRFVTGTVNGGGGNQWEIRGGNAQEGDLTTFYKGPRPGSRENSNYYPMHRQGAIQMGNGGDNGNGSAGTFYEGVVTTGYPAEAVTDAVQANIVAARYAMPAVSLSRATTFTPGSSQDVTATFTNTTGVPAAGVAFSVSVPSGWAVGAAETSRTFADPVAPGVTVSTTFRVTPPATTGTGLLTGKAEWTNPTAGRIRSETMAQRVRNVPPIKINEVRFSTGDNPTNQFVELYNAGAGEVDLSRWTLVHTQSQWAPVELATIPAGTKLAAKGFYLLGLAGSGLAAPVGPGATTIHVRSTTGFEAGQQIDIDGERRVITSVGTPAAAMTTVFVPVSTGPWITIPAGSPHLPVTSAAGFEVGQKIGIDMGGNYEVATVTVVGKAATQTTLAADANAGDTRIQVAANSDMTVGDTLKVGTGGRKELIAIKSIVRVSAALRGGRGGFGGGGGAGEVELAAPLQFDHMSGVDVSDVGTGIRFTPATRFPHASGDAVQALGSGITLDSPLEKSHAYGAAVVHPLAKTAGYQGPPAPNQWFGGPLSTSAGSIALMDASGVAVVDAIVYGSQQSNSSGNGTIASPEIATLEGDQGQGGCIVVVPSSGRGGFGMRGGSGAGEANKSVGRFPDGFDADSLCTDFLTQTATILSIDSAVGANRIKVESVAGLSAGQTILVDTGENRETAVIATVGTPGGTTVATATEAGATVVSVASAAGFAVGQTITMDRGANLETAVVASVRGGRRGRGGPGGTTVTVASPLKSAHAVGAQVSGTGIALKGALAKAHAGGVQVAGGVPTPGAPNQYVRRPQ